jgi:hypothetical protein
LYSFDPRRRIWAPIVQNLSSVPAARWFHGFSEAKGKLFVFGGMSDTGELKISFDMAFVRA